MNYNIIKIQFLLLLFSCLIFLSSYRNSSEKEIRKTIDVKQNLNFLNSKNENTKENESIINSIKLFLNWYRINETQLYKFDCIKGGKPKMNYYVDFNEVKKELIFLKKSEIFSSVFIENYQKRYEIGNEYFKVHPQKDGPPHGFEYDYFFLTQEDFHDDLTQIDNIKFKVIKIINDKCQVTFNLENCGMKYKYSLTKSKTWQIDKIENNF